MPNKQTMNAADATYADGQLVLCIPSAVMAAVQPIVAQDGSKFLVDDTVQPYDKANLGSACLRCFAEWAVKWQSLASEVSLDPGLDSWFTTGNQTDAEFQNALAGAIPGRGYCTRHRQSLRYCVAFYWGLGGAVAGHIGWGLQIPDPYVRFFEAYTPGIVGANWLVGSYALNLAASGNDGNMTLERVGSPEECFAGMGYSYLTYVDSPTGDFEWAIAKASNEYKASYVLLGHNCENVAYDILAEGGALGMPDPSVYLLPAQWFKDTSDLAGNLKVLDTSVPATITVPANSPTPAPQQSRPGTSSDTTPTATPGPRPGATPPPAQQSSVRAQMTAFHATAKKKSRSARAAAARNGIGVPRWLRSALHVAASAPWPYQEALPVVTEPPLPSRAYILDQDASAFHLHEECEALQQSTRTWSAYDFDQPLDAEGLIDDVLPACRKCLGVWERPAHQPLFAAGHGTRHLHVYLDRIVLVEHNLLGNVKATRCFAMVDVGNVVAKGPSLLDHPRLVFTIGERQYDILFFKQAERDFAYDLLWALIERVAPQSRS